MFYLMRKEQKKQFPSPCNFHNFFFWQNTVAHTIMKILKIIFLSKRWAKIHIWRKKLYFDHFIRENSNWILLQFKIWCQFWREISNYLYCNKIHLIKFSDKIVYLISLCVAVDKSDAKDPVWNFCSRRKKKIGKKPEIVLCRDRRSSQPQNWYIPALSGVHQHHHNCINKYYGMAHWRWSSSI